MTDDGANQRWAAMLSRWAIPEALVEAALESPYFFSPAVFIHAGDDALKRTHDTPSDAVAREALPENGTILDVGAGAGTASLRLSPRHVIGVDPNEELLDAFAARAAQHGVQATTIRGGWPDVESGTPRADVALCHHVVYNVADLASFVSALCSHVERRVVIELTAVHPMTWMSPYWQALHNITQPDRPTADDAVAVLNDLDLNVHQEQWERPVQMIGENEGDAVARIARRLCLPADRHDELAALLTRIPPPVRREVVTLWWDLP